MLPSVDANDSQFFINDSVSNTDIFSGATILYPIFRNADSMQDSPYSLFNQNLLPENEVLVKYNFPEDFVTGILLVISLTTSPYSFVKYLVLSEVATIELSGIITFSKFDKTLIF